MAFPSRRPLCRGFRGRATVCDGHLVRPSAKGSCRGRCPLSTPHAFRGRPSHFLRRHPRGHLEGTRGTLSFARTSPQGSRHLALFLIDFPTRNASPNLRFFFFFNFYLFDLLARAFSNVCSPPGKRSTHSGCRFAGNVSLCFVAHFQTSDQRRSRTRRSL